MRALGKATLIPGTADCRADQDRRSDQDRREALGRQPRSAEPGVGVAGWRFPEPRRRAGRRAGRRVSVVRAGIGAGAVTAFAVEAGNGRRS